MPAPRAPQTGPARVDLDMPFSLDQPAVPVPVTSPRPLATARTGAGPGEPAQGFAGRQDGPSPSAAAGASPDYRPSPHDTAPYPGGSTRVDGPHRAGDVPTGGRPTTGGDETGDPANDGPTSGSTSPTDGGSDGTTNGSAGEPTDGSASELTNDSAGGPTDDSAGKATDGSAGDPANGGAGGSANGGAGGGATSGGPVNGGGARMPAESPWAQPPQRPTTSAAEPGPGSGATGPAPTHQGAALRQALHHQQPAQPGPVDQGIPPQGPADQRPLRQGPPQSGAPHVPFPHDSEGRGVPVGPAPGPYPPQQGGPTPPGPYPPGWHPPPWQQAAPAPQQAYQPAEGVTAVPPAQPDANWHPAITDPPTAEDFARRRQVRPADPVATMGVRAVANRMGLRLPPGRHEQELRRDIETVRRNFGGLRQVTVVNPKGGAGKTVAILLLAMTFGQKRGGYVLAWDNNETQGTLGMRAQQDFHSRTVRDMLRDLGQFQGAHGRVGDLSQYVRSQGEGMFDVLASDESATGGEMLTAAAFAEIREVVSRFYKLIFVDTGNNVRAQNWQAAMDATDQLVVTMSARNDSAETAARMLDHLEQSGRQRLVRQAVTVVSMPPSRKEIDLPAIQEHFAARTRAVLLAPYERLIDTGEPIRYGGLSAATRDAWLKIAAAVAEGL
ncbi:MinD-like ATPase involved in chromosome partitioning or flagellar assembly [Micromonospora sp. M71_S20]|nr:MinD-like ATPase involved in chromosome partitioning or flagellar assembly [Micromonospora sp. M71_S20]